ncbi:hypothetical protein DPX16_23147 [Anabarilius grahami]|uniref:Uncharacterized protein n=1 Tax=Anabarilius grahami TaxID=495550 RepID=A0A3N0XHR7_ANAGA|nr:hypothetical protein DPX16_23147 [Anabarilius grahami]
MDAEEVEALKAMSEGESDGGEISEASWVCSASDDSSDSDPEPPRKISSPVDYMNMVEVTAAEVAWDGVKLPA